MRATNDAIEIDQTPLPFTIHTFTVDDDLDPIISAWASAFAEPPNGPRPIGELQRQLFHYMVFPHFTGLIARENDSTIIGMIFGYSNEAGQWWNDRVAQAMGPRQSAQLLDDSFCLMELGVVPAARRHGVGEALVATLGAQQPHPRMLLSTRSDNAPGQRFYGRTGWHTVLHEMSFGWNFPPYAILMRPTIPET